MSTWEISITDQPTANFKIETRSKWPGSMEIATIPRFIVECRGCKDPIHVSGPGTTQGEFYYVGEGVTLICLCGTFYTENDMLRILWSLEASIRDNHNKKIAAIWNALEERISQEKKALKKRSDYYDLVDQRARGRISACIAAQTGLVTTQPNQVVTLEQVLRELNNERRRANATKQEFPRSEPAQTRANTTLTTLDELEALFQSGAFDLP